MNLTDIRIGPVQRLVAPVDVAFVQHAGLLKPLLQFGKILCHKGFVLRSAQLVTAKHAARVAIGAATAQPLYIYHERVEAPFAKVLLRHLVELGEVDIHSPVGVDGGFERSVEERVVRGYLIVQIGVQILVEDLFLLLQSI